MAGGNAEGVFPKEDGDVVYGSDINTIRAFLGEVRQFALSETGAVTKATLQTAGWAICDGTTATAQGIASADITASTPNLENKFIRMSADESSGTTGGASGIHAHGAADPGNWANWVGGKNMSNADFTPPYHELVYFMKVKLNI